MTRVLCAAVAIAFVAATVRGPAARGESLAAFDGRCIPAGCVAPRSNTPGILVRRALPAGRLPRLGATPDSHHGLLAYSTMNHPIWRRATRTADRSRISPRRISSVFL